MGARNFITDYFRRRRLKRVLFRARISPELIDKHLKSPELLTIAPPKSGIFDFALVLIEDEGVGHFPAPGTNNHVCAGITRFH